MENKDYYIGNMEKSIIADFVDFQECEQLYQEADQLTKVIKQEKYNSLSKEAKEVISLVINTPSEIMDIITTPKGAKSKNLLKNYLYKKWRSNFLINSIFQEISEFVKNF